MDFKLFAVMMFFGFLATEGIVEYFFGKFAEFFGLPEKYGKLFLPLLSAVVGIGLAFHYVLDIPYLWLGMPASSVGIAITGFVMGRGANMVHSVASLIADWAKIEF